MRRFRRWWGGWGVGLLGLLGAASPAVAQDSRIPVEVLQARRAALLDLVGSGVAVIRSADRLELSDHPQASDFRQDSDFYYLTGLETPRSWLVLVARGAGPDSAILYLPPRDPAEERWTGPQLGPGPEAASLSGVAEARSSASFFDDVAARVRSGGAPGPLFLPRSSAERTQSLRHLLTELGVEVKDLDRAVASLRIVKDSVEVARLRRAITITVEALREAMRAAEPGLYEYELEAVIEYVFRRNGAERVGFPSIVASGPNSVILHYDRNRRGMEAGDVVVVDVGAEYAYYTADVTRTFPVSGRFTLRQRALYELVLAAQDATISAVRPGVTVGELNQVARRHLRDHSGGLCGARTCDEYFIHGVAHWLGMDVHDVGDYAAPLRPGMVLTIEPGVYLADEALGIRIEDDLLVTEDGAEVLSGAAPRTVAEIEAAMRERPLTPLRATGGAIETKGEW